MRRVKRNLDVLSVNYEVSNCEVCIVNYEVINVIVKC